MWECLYCDFTSLAKLLHKRHLKYINDTMSLLRAGLAVHLRAQAASEMHLIKMFVWVDLDGSDHYN